MLMWEHVPQHLYTVNIDIYTKNINVKSRRVKVEMGIGKSPTDVCNQYHNRETLNPCH